MAEKIKNILTNLLFPPTCLACGVTLPPFPLSEKKLPLCEKCLAIFQEQKKTQCNRCSHYVCDCQCPTELMSKAKINSFAKLTFYNTDNVSVQDKLIFELKKKKNLRLLSFLAEETKDKLSDFFTAEQDIILCYLPRSHKALNQEGNDQAKELAKALSKTFSLPCLPLISRKKFGNKEQKALPLTARKENVKNAFYLNQKLKNQVFGKRILLIDDIVTTGAGMSYCAKLLYQAGAKEVCSFALASSDYNRDFHN